MDFFRWMWNWVAPPPPPPLTSVAEDDPPAHYVRTPKGNAEHAKMGEPSRWPETGTPLDFVLRYPNLDKINEIIRETGIYTLRLRAAAELALPHYDGLLEVLLQRGLVTAE